MQHPLIALARDAVRWTLFVEGSTRPAALLRIGVVGLGWSEWGMRFLAMRTLEPIHIATGVALSVFGFLALVGLWTRFATVGFAATLLTIYYYWGHVRGVEAYVHHHSWLLVWGGIGVACLPSGRSWSVDRWRALARADRLGTPPPLERGALWGSRLVALQVSLVYFWGAVDKLQPGFVSGARMQHHWIHYYGLSDYPSWTYFPPAAQAVAWTTIGLEFILAVSLWIPRLQPASILAGIVFHFGLFQLLPVGTFSVAMYLFYLAYLDADAVHRVFDRLHGAPSPGGPVR